MTEISIGVWKRKQGTEPTLPSTKRQTRSVHRHVSELRKEQTSTDSNTTATVEDLCTGCRNIDFDSERDNSKRII